MKKTSLYTIWGVLYIICAGLGFIQEPQGILRGMMIGMALLFFVPPILLLAGSAGDPRTRRRICCLSAISLGVTLVLILANILAAFGGEGLGVALHVALVICSAPMFCGIYWILSLFLWAALLFATLGKK